MTVDLVKLGFSSELRKPMPSALLDAGLALGVVSIVGERKLDRQRP